MADFNTGSVKSSTQQSSLTKYSLTVGEKRIEKIKTSLKKAKGTV